MVPMGLKAGKAKVLMLTTGTKHPHAGFSLIELLVVLTIIGLFISVVPAMLSTGGVEFKGLARNLASSLRSAKANSISHQQDVVVSFNLENKTYNISNDKRQYAIPEGIEIAFKPQSLSAKNDDDEAINLYFYADGGASGGKLIITKGETGRYEVLIDWLTGQVSIAE